MAVLLTRPAKDSARIAALLAEQGVSSLTWPLVEIVPVGGALEVPEGTEALLFTSAHAVRQFGELSPRRDLPALCVGATTAGAARDAGLSDVAEAAGTAEDLINLAMASGLDRFLYLRGRDVSVDLSAELGARGYSVTERVVYAADAATSVDARADAALKAGKIAAITVWSARQAAILAGFAETSTGWSLETVDLIAISTKAAAPLHNSGFRRILVASRPDAQAMIREIRAAVRQ